MDTKKWLFKQCRKKSMTKAILSSALIGYPQRMQTKQDSTEDYFLQNTGYMIQQKSLFRKNRVLVSQNIIIIKSNYCERIYVLLKKQQSNPYYPLEECTFILKQLLPRKPIQWRRKVIMLQKIYISWVMVDVDRFGGLRHRPTDLFLFFLFF